MSVEKEHFEEPSFKAVIFSKGDVFVCTSGGETGNGSSSISSISSNGGEGA